MIVDVPFLYRAEVRFRRKRNTNEVVCRGLTQVLVAETDLASAPVAMRHVRASAVAEESVLVEYRLFDCQLYEPLLRNDGSGLPKQRDAPWLLSRVAGLVPPGNPLFVGAWSQRRDAVPMSELPDVAEIVDSDEESVVATAHASAGALLLIDGALFERAPEPVYRLRHVERPSTAGNVVDGRWVLYVDTAANVLAAEPAGGDIDGVYAADQFDLIRDYIDSRSDSDWVHGAAPPPIELLIPEAVRFDPDPLILRSCAETCLRKLREHVFGGRSDGLVRMLRTVIEKTPPLDDEADFHEELSRLVRSRDDAASVCFRDLRDLLSRPDDAVTLDGIARCVGAAHGVLAASGGRALSEHLCERIERTLARWEKRSLGGIDFGL